jgi:ubiquinone/menaquinone biosynthesis C-methylase UbiE
MLTANLDRLGLTPSDRVLDLGAGFGRHAFAALRRGSTVVALDAGEAEMEAVQGMITAMREANEISWDASAVAIRGDVLALPFLDNSFDVVICSEVLEHIPAEALAIAELARVIKIGGRIAITVPRTLPERINWALSDDYHNVPGGHIRIYSRSYLEQLLTNAQFRIEGHEYAHGLHSPYWWLKCLVGIERNEQWLVKRYHQLLVWDIMKSPRITRTLEQVLSKFIGKSLIIYATKMDK